MIKKICDLVELFTETISSAFIFIVTIILVLQVFMRFVLSSGIPWAEEVAKYLTIWAVMLGAPIMIKKNNLIRVDFLDNIWNQTFSRIKNTIFNIFICFILAILVYQGWLLAEHGRNSMCLSIPINLFWAYLAIPVGTSLMLFFYLINLLKCFRNEKGEHTC